jgi:transcriptional regulator with XRE-family HTH domain
VLGVARGVADQNFRENVKAARLRSGMSQDTLASRMARLGWAYRQQTVTDIENGRRAVPVGEALDLAAVLGSDIPELTRPPEQAEAGARLAGLARETRTAHVEAANWTAEFRASRASLREALADADGIEGIESALAEGRAAVVLKLGWER